MTGLSNAFINPHSSLVTPDLIRVPLHRAARERQRDPGLGVGVTEERPSHSECTKPLCPTLAWLWHSNRMTASKFIETPDFRPFHGPERFSARTVFHPFQAVGLPPKS